MNTETRTAANILTLEEHAAAAAATLVSVGELLTRFGVPRLNRAARRRRLRPVRAKPQRGRRR